MDVTDTASTTPDRSATALPPAGSMTFEGTDLVLADPGHEMFARLRRPRLSPSTSNAIQECPARWAAGQTTPREDDPYAAMNVGTAAHAVMEDLYGRPFDKRTPDDAHNLLMTITDRHPYLCTPDRDNGLEMAKWRDKVILAMHGLWQVEDPSTIKFSQLELQLNQVEIDGVPLNGCIDRLDISIGEDGKPATKIVDYKGLAVDTPIPTPAGWTTMGEVQVGDEVLGTTGLPVRVTQKSGIHNRPCYRVTFKDGSSVVCDNVHLWDISRDRNDADVRTETMDADELARRWAAGQRDLFIPNAAALKLPESDLPAEPYLLGSRRGQKSIPAAYLRASADQRLVLLQGLMDTDGSWAKSRGQAVFTTTTLALADAVSELVRSLGGHVSRFSKDYQNAVRPDATVHMVSFTPAGFNPFRLPRKAGTAQPHVDSPSVRATRRYITGVEVVDSVPTQCIAVDSADHLYLCGEAMVPTHNTGKWSAASKLKMFGDDYAEAMRVYALGVEQMTGQVPAEALLIYTAVGKSRTIPLGPRLLKATREKFVDSWRRLNEYTETGRWPTKPSGLCAYCPLATVCPAANAEKVIEPKTTGYKFGEMLMPRIHPESAAAPPPPLTPPEIGTDPYREVYADIPPPPDPEPPDYTQTIGDVAPEPVRHTTPETQPPVDQEHQMTTAPFRNNEERPMEETAAGDLNANSFASTAAFGTTSLAMEYLHEQEQPLTKPAIQSMAHTFNSLVLSVQHDLSGYSNMQRGLNTRLRGVLRTILTIQPAPFGQDEVAWTSWYNQARARMTFIAITAYELWNVGPVDRPWAALVSDAA